MARDKNLLSDREFFSKTAHIVEQVRNCKINITYYEKQNMIEEKISAMDAKENGGKHTYKLNVATPSIKGIEKFTAFNHEIGHILLETPIPEAREVIEGWVLADEDQRKKQGMYIYKTKDGAMRKKTYWDMYNILEDQRIESLMADIWLANKKRFIRARTNRGKLHTQCKDNPIDTILNIRFCREDLAKNRKHFNEFKQALEDVENTGRLGGLLILARIKPLIDKFYDDKAKTEKRLLNLEKRAKTPNTKGKHEKAILKQISNEHEEEEYDGNDSKLNNKPENKKDNVSNLPELTKNPAKLEEKIAESKEVGKNTVQDIKTALMGEGSLDAIATPSYVSRIEREESEVEISKDVSSGLKKIFRKIAEMPKEKIGYDGDEIDMDAYLEGKIRGYDISNCFIDKKISNGASVVISIDGSGSMDGHRIETVRKLVASLYDSVKDVPNVEIKANIWSSDGMGNCGITDINNKEDCKFISVKNNGRCWLTPTHLAVDYSARQVKRMHGRRKLVIFLTDGVPQYQNNHRTMKKDVMVKMTRKALLRLRRATPHIMVIGIGTSSHSAYYLNEIFGKKRLMHVSNIRDASETVVKKFKELVVRTMK
jgi:uncharacterized protein YegL